MNAKNDPLKPSAALLVKLGSIIVHQEEMMSPKGHHFDKHALETVRNDPEVVAWLDQMTDMAMLPANADTMNAIPITPETPPQFPCWLLTRIISGDPKIWCRAKTNPGGLALSYCSHWHPDQPAAPIAPPTPSVMDKLTEETERLGLYDTVVPPPTPQTTEEEIDFIKYRFPSREAYQQWCEDMVTKIYYAQIAMNNDSIREVVAEIGMKLWLQEGVELYGSPTPQESPVGRDGEDKH